MRTELNINNFDGQILKDAGPIAVLFDAKWCPFCREFARIFELLQRSRVPSAHVDLSDTSNPLWETFSVEIVPTVLIFNSGKVVRRYDGVAGQGLDATIIQGIISNFEAH